MTANYTVPCSTCGVGPGETCRTLTTGRVTDTHMARMYAQYPRCGRCGLDLIDGRCQIVGCGA